MKITITIKNEQDGKSYDVSLDNRQKIATTLKVMSENLPEFMKESEPIRRYSLNGQVGT